MNYLDHLFVYILFDFFSVWLLKVHFVEINALLKDNSYLSIWIFNSFVSFTIESLEHLKSIHWLIQNKWASLVSYYCWYNSDSKCITMLPIKVNEFLINCLLIFFSSAQFKSCFVSLLELKWVSSPSCHGFHYF